MGSHGQRRACLSRSLAMSKPCMRPSAVKGTGTMQQAWPGIARGKRRGKLEIKGTWVGAGGLGAKARQGLGAALPRAGEAPNTALAARELVWAGHRRDRPWGAAHPSSPHPVWGPGCLPAAWALAPAPAWGPGRLPGEALGRCTMPRLSA